MRWRPRMMWMTRTSPALLLALGLAAGCEGEKRVTSPDQQAAAGNAAPADAEAAPPSGEMQTRETINKTTQNVLKLEDALAQGGVLADTTIPATDYLSQQAAGYRTTVGRIGSMNAAHQMDLYRAEHIMEGDKPISYDEFMAQIIRKGQPDGMQLAMLPYYQEYAYDEANEKLVVVDFPAKKAQRKAEQDKRFGRD